MSGFCAQCGRAIEGERRRHPLDGTMTVQTYEICPECAKRGGWYMRVLTEGIRKDKD